MDYIEAATIRTCEILIMGRSHIVERLPLFGHHKLKTIEEKIVKHENDITDLIFEYIQIATGMADIENISVEELPMIFDSLVELNNIRVEDTLPWQKTYNAEPSVKVNVDYDGRELAIIVDILSSAYGWDIETIYQLTPELAACYVQEALINDWKMKEFQYMLSRVAYDKDGQYKPFPKPSWYIETVGATMEEAKAMIPSRFMPSGVIYDFTKQK